MVWPSMSFVQGGKTFNRTTNVPALITNLIFLPSGYVMYPPMSVERHAAVLRNKFSNADNRTMNFGVLNSELVNRAIGFSMLHMDFPKVGYEVPRCKLVVKPGLLSLADMDFVTWEFFLAVGHSGLTSGIHH